MQINDLKPMLDAPLEDLTPAEANAVQGGIVIDVTGFFGVFGSGSSRRSDNGLSGITINTTGFRLNNSFLEFPGGNISL